MTQAPPLVSWQYALPLVTSHRAGPDATGAGAGGADTDAPVVPQITQPAYEAEASEYHPIVEPAAIGTFDGPMEPE